MPIKEAHRHKTAFRGAAGGLYEFNRCGFGLQTIPAVFTAQLGDTFRPALLAKGSVEKWLDNILLHNKTLKVLLPLFGRFCNYSKYGELAGYLPWIENNASSWKGTSMQAGNGEIIPPLIVRRSLYDRRDASGQQQRRHGSSAVSKHQTKRAPILLLDEKAAWSRLWLTSLTDQGVESNFKSVAPMLINRKTAGT